MICREGDAAALWRQWLAEPQAPPSGAQMLDRARLRLNAFCFGDEADEAKAPGWPLNPEQERAIAACEQAGVAPVDRPTHSIRRHRYELNWTGHSLACRPCASKSLGAPLLRKCMVPV